MGLFNHHKDTAPETTSATHPATTHAQGLQQDSAAYGQQQQPGVGVQGSNDYAYQQTGSQGVGGAYPDSGLAHQQAGLPPQHGVGGAGAGAYQQPQGTGMGQHPFSQSQQPHGTTHHRAEEAVGVAGAAGVARHEHNKHATEAVVPGGHSSTTAQHGHGHGHGHGKEAVAAGAGGAGAAGLMHELKQEEHRLMQERREHEAKKEQVRQLAAQEHREAEQRLEAAKNELKLAKQNEKETKKM